MVDTTIDKVAIPAIKLICIDLDGTVLNSSKQITAANRRAIDRARDAGIDVAIRSILPSPAMEWGCLIPPSAFRVPLSCLSTMRCSVMD